MEDHISCFFIIDWFCLIDPTVETGTIERADNMFKSLLSLESKSMYNTITFYNIELVLNK